MSQPAGPRSPAEAGTYPCLQCGERPYTIEAWGLLWCESCIIEARYAKCGRCGLYNDDRSPCLDCYARIHADQPGHGFRVLKYALRRRPNVDLYPAGSGCPRCGGRTATLCTSKVDRPIRDTVSWYECDGCGAILDPKHDHELPSFVLVRDDNQRTLDQWRDNLWNFKRKDVIDI